MSTSPFIEAQRRFTSPVSTEQIFPRTSSFSTDTDVICTGSTLSSSPTAAAAASTSTAAHTLSLLATPSTAVTAAATTATVAGTLGALTGASKPHRLTSALLQHGISMDLALKLVHKYSDGNIEELKKRTKELEELRNDSTLRCYSDLRESIRSSKDKSLVVTEMQSVMTKLLTECKDASSANLIKKICSLLVAEQAQVFDLSSSSSSSAPSSSSSSSSSSIPSSPITGAPTSSYLSSLSALSSAASAAAAAAAAGGGAKYFVGSSPTIPIELDQEGESKHVTRRSSRSTEVSRLMCHPYQKKQQHQQQSSSLSSSSLSLTDAPRRPASTSINSSSSSSSSSGGSVSSGSNPKIYFEIKMIPLTEEDEQGEIEYEVFYHDHKDSSDLARQPKGLVFWPFDGAWLASKENACYYPMKPGQRSIRMICDGRPKVRVFVILGGAFESVAPYVDIKPPTTEIKGMIQLVKMTPKSSGAKAGLVYGLKIKKDCVSYMGSAWRIVGHTEAPRLRSEIELLLKKFKDVLDGVVEKQQD